MLGFDASPQTSWQVYSDSLDIQEIIYKPATLGLAGAVSPLATAARAAYAQRGALGNPDKDVLRATCAQWLGGVIDGVAGTRSAPTAFTQELVCLTLWLLCRRRAARKPL